MVSSSTRMSSLTKKARSVIPVPNPTVTIRTAAPTLAATAARYRAAAPCAATARSDWARSATPANWRPGARPKPATPTAAPARRATTRAGSLVVQPLTSRAAKTLPIATAATGPAAAVCRDRACGMTGANRFAEIRSPRRLISRRIPTTARVPFRWIGPSATITGTFPSAVTAGAKRVSSATPAPNRMRTTLTAARIVACSPVQSPTITAAIPTSWFRRSAGCRPACR